jgi:hypothetical protein
MYTADVFASSAFISAILYLQLLRASVVFGQQTHLLTTVDDVYADATVYVCVCYQIFSRMDRDGNGEVEADEFTRALEDMGEQLLYKSVAELRRENERFTTSDRTRRLPP